MSSTNRRSLLKAPLVTPDRLATAAGPTVDAPTLAQSRRSFLQASAGGGFCN